MNNLLDYKVIILLSALCTGCFIAGMFANQPPEHKSHNVERFEAQRTPDGDVWVRLNGQFVYRLEGICKPQNESHLF